MFFGQLNVRKCNECGQPLPESFEPLANEPWTTEIFGCAEDTESCRFSFLHLGYQKTTLSSCFLFLELVLIPLCPW